MGEWHEHTINLNDLEKRLVKLEEHIMLLSRAIAILMEEKSEIKTDE